jgi:uncharacterized protein YbjT (DUF2867 family)
VQVSNCGEACGMNVVIAGASGLVGSAALRLLEAREDVSNIVSLARRAASQTSTKVTTRIVDFAALGTLPAHDACIIALGTTMKTAGSKEAFRAVDYDAVVSVAEASRNAGATRIGLVSALGASATSSVFYNQVKGEAEARLVALGFTTYVIVRPSLLAGDRSESRPGERIALAFANVLKPLIPKKYQAIDAALVARALVDATLTAGPGRLVLESDVLQAAQAAR